MEDLINDFDINNINKSGAKFDREITMAKFTTHPVNER